MSQDLTTQFAYAFRRRLVVAGRRLALMASVGLVYCSGHASLPIGGSMSSLVAAEEIAEDVVGSQVIEPKLLARIPPGTPVFDTDNRGFSNLVLFVKGRLTAGDVDAVSDTTRYYADLFNLVYMVNVKKSGERFLLDKIAVGFSSKLNNQDRVVTSETAKAQGLDLNFIGRSVLSGNEKALEEIMIVAQNDTCAVIDAPSVVQYENKHQRMMVRFFVWVAPTSGKVGTTAWLLKINKTPNRDGQTDGGKYSFAESTFNFLPPELIEDRVMHVNGDEFTLGIPSAEAFAMVKIPSGRTYQLTDRLQKSGSTSQFTAESLRELAASLSEAMGLQR